MRWALIIAVMAFAGCSRGDASDEPRPAPRALAGARAHAPASATAGALAQIPDSPGARRRLAYVDLQSLARVDLPFAERDVLSRVLGRVPFGDAATAVRAGRGALVLQGRAPASPPPETSAITPAAPSAVQSCLGETLAQTIVGPAVMGNDAAIGVGLAQSGDAPAGLQLRLCGAPHYVRDLHAMRRSLQRIGATAAEREIGEREIVAGVLPADALAPREALRLLAGGRELRALAWR